uniref:Uncharacterized protein n=2 Tax=Dunaliella tertiolecta TaxID=3047 RepID=A0A7S3QZC9_DUNTE
MPEKKHTTRQSAQNQAATKDGRRDGPGPAAAVRLPSPDTAGKISRTASEEGSQVPPSKRARGLGSGTPKCGTCQTCRNPSLKKACLTNRERMAAGKEPIVG